MTDIVNKMAEYLECSRCLEVGDAPSVIRDVSTPVRIAAGANAEPLPDGDGVSYYRCDALAFLREGASDAGKTETSGPDEKKGLSSWDIIIINEPTFPRAWRLFRASLCHAHTHTVWFVANILPTNRNGGEADSSGNESAAFKTIFSLHDECPEFSYCTLFDVEEPFSVVWRQPLSIPQEKKFPSLEAIESLHFFELFKHPDLMNPLPVDNLFTWVGLPYKANAGVVQAGLTSLLRRYYRLPDGRDEDLIPVLINSVIGRGGGKETGNARGAEAGDGNSVEAVQNRPDDSFPNLPQRFLLLLFHLLLKLGPEERLKRYEDDPETFFVRTGNRYCLLLRKILAAMGPDPRDDNSKRKCLS